MEYNIRALINGDDSIVWKMLMYASHESLLETVQKQPQLSRYAIDWGRMGDMGFVAWFDEQFIGAAWLRFGYVNEYHLQRLRWINTHSLRYKSQPTPAPARILLLKTTQPPPPRSNYS
jgi:hypothetical protein